MAAEWEEKVVAYVGRVESESGNVHGQRGKPTIFPDNFSCGRVMKAVSSLLLHRSAHYGSYDLISSSSILTKDDFVEERFRRRRSKSHWSDAAVDGSDQCASKLRNLSFSVSDDDLKTSTNCGRQKSRRKCKRDASNRRSLNADNFLQANKFDGILLKSLHFTSADNLPLDVAAKSTDAQCDNGPLSEELFTLAEMGEPEGSDSRVWVHNLRLANEFGGILDPDDTLLAVVEDKEQIVAIYDEQEPTGSSSAFRNGTDLKTNGHGAIGSGGSRVPSPKLKDDYVSSLGRLRGCKEKRKAEQQNGVTWAEKNSVLVDEQSATGTSSGLLVVRRGSEPVLNVVNYGDEAAGTTTNGAGVVRRRVEFLNAELKNKQHEDEPAMAAENAKTGTGRFARTAARKSRMTDEWLEVAALAAEEYRAKEIGNKDFKGEERNVLQIVRLSPPKIDEPDRAGWLRAFDFSPEYETTRDRQQELKALIVKRVPAEATDSGTENVEEKLHVGDKIFDIGDQAISQMAFEKAVNYLYQTCDRDGAVNLTVSRSHSSQYHPPAPVFPASTDASAIHTDSAAKPPPTLTSVAPMAALQKGNTRRIGQRLKIDLTKQPPPDGFGFTLTSRDNELSSSRTSDSGTQEPLVYVKTICPKGAAIEDGRLKAGDRLLEVNDIKLSNKFGQPEVVGLLREIKAGEVASLVISRQTTTPAEPRSETDKRISSSLPRPLKEETEDEKKVVQDTFSNGKYEHAMLTFDIPLNDTGSAGLGVSVKGRLATDQDGQRRDGGIFVKAILHGGAGHKDGRLRVNDRVVAVEGVDLSGLSNEVAMQRLRSILMDLNRDARSIRLTVFRLMPHNKPENEGGSTSNDGSTGFSADGGRHRLLVNEHSSNLINKNVINYGDENYATIVKTPSTRPVTTVGNFIGQWPNSDDDEPAVMIEWSESAAPNNRHLKASRSDSTGSSWAGDRLSRRDCDVDGSREAVFVRDAPTRRSMSEKRHAGRIDPSSTATFQRIQHQRQTSAPSLQRRPIGSGSLINSSTKRVERHVEWASETPSATTAERRSLSLESVHRGDVQASEATMAPHRGSEKKEKPLLHEEVAQSLQKTNKIPPAPNGGGVKWLKSKSAASRQRPTNESFRQAVDRSYAGDSVEVGVDVFDDVANSHIGQGDHVVQAQEPYYAQISHSPTADSILATNRSRPVNKEKDRRKSTGSGLSLKNLFRFGSGGKADRPFAVVSPVNNETQQDDGDVFDTYSKLSKHSSHRHKSQERERRLGNEQKDRNISGGIERLSVEKTKYHANGQLQRELERQHEMEAQAIARRQHEDEQRRIRQHYERMKEEHMKQQHAASFGAPAVVTRASPAGSKSPKTPYLVQPKMPTQWRPPLPPSSPPQTRIRAQPVMGREMVVQVQHGRQHSGGGSTNSSGSRLQSPARSGQYHSRQPGDYYLHEDGGYYHRFPHPPSAMAAVPSQNLDHGYADGKAHLQGVDNRRFGTNKSSHKAVSPVPQSCWFVDGVGGGSSVRHHRFYYSSMDGRPTERSHASKHNGAPPNSSVHSIKDSRSMTTTQVRCTSEHASNSHALIPSTSLVTGTRQGQITSFDRGTSNQPQQWNGRHQEQSYAHHQSSAATPMFSSDDRRKQDGRHQVIIGSIPIFDSTKTDGVTRIVIDGNGQKTQPPPLPPPDYEQYLRSRRAKKALGGVQPSRPCSEFIGDNASVGAKYDCSSLPRRAGPKKTTDQEVDVIMATPPARNVHYFYHPQQQLK